MKIILNDKESLVITSKRSKKGYCIISRGDWLGVREFTSIETSMNKGENNE